MRGGFRNSKGRNPIGQRKSELRFVGSNNFRFSEVHVGEGGETEQIEKWDGTEAETVGEEETEEGETGEGGEAEQNGEDDDGECVAS